MSKKYFPTPQEPTIKPWVVKAQQALSIEIKY